jgi:hypothetical protein
MKPYVSPSVRAACINSPEKTTHQDASGSTIVDRNDPEVVPVCRSYGSFKNPGSMPHDLPAALNKERPSADPHPSRPFRGVKQTTDASTTRGALSMRRVLRRVRTSSGRDVLAPHDDGLTAGFIQGAPDGGAALTGAPPQPPNFTDATITHAALPSGRKDPGLESGPVDGVHLHTRRGQPDTLSLRWGPLTGIAPRRGRSIWLCSSRAPSPDPTPCL